MPRFVPTKVWSRLSEGDLTLFMGVPTTYMALIRAREEASPQQQKAMSEGCSKLRLMVSGSAPLPVSVFERWKETTGQVLLERYGMTEVGMALSNPLRGERIPGTVGFPLPGVDVRLVELDRHHLAESGERRYGETVTPERDGQARARAPMLLEIQVKGPTVFQEYWRRPEATRKAFTEDGWFCTGDAGSLKDGRYVIEGRVTQDIIISGGENISAIAVENDLAEHSQIAESAVVGVKDPYWGEAVSAAVVLRPGSDLASLDDRSFRQAIRNWAKKRVAEHRVPWHVFRYAELPRNAMGKVIKPRVIKLVEASIEASKDPGL
jgi:malonyl-CoA/methylmalonyl-CoA synthetase